MIHRVLWGAAVLACAVASRPVHASPLDGSKQLVVVTTPGWRATTGILQRFAREDATQPWRAIGPRVRVVVGRRGLGRGAGLVALDLRGPKKREGDRRAPAGVFALGPAFGTESSPGSALPYLRIHDGHRCVDDARSRHYGRIVDARRVDVDFASAEHLARLGVYSRLAVVVQHNPTHAPGRGSCIFLHAWGRRARPTVGCTAMPMRALRALAGWLDPRHAPLLVQLPKRAWRRVREALGFRRFAPSRAP